ncbi:ester cyclase [Halorussus salinisoli]|uniref:ester cyclase n=1 Tax=Halorussus salinisoli TaxID=2558242 RepID=UPI0014857F10|nr:ester cyclase [Halorussus salinisoli]
MSEIQDQRETNKKAAQQIFDVWDGGDIDALNDVIAEDVILHTPEALRGTLHGRDAYKDNLRMSRGALPDLFFEPNDVVAENDTVMAYCTFGGIHEGEVMGIEPTGKEVEVEWFGLYRFDDGKVVEVNGLPDLLGLFVQLGVIEPPGE